MSLLDNYIDLLKNYKFKNVNNVRNFGIPLKKIRKMRLLEKLKNEEIESRKEIFNIMYGNKDTNI